VTVGTISGAGTFKLGAVHLVVGTNSNWSCEVSGSVQDGGVSGQTGGSLATTGLGTLTLSGVNTYTGATSIGAGTTLRLVGGGSIAASSAVLDNGSFDISGAATAVFVEGLAGSGTVALGSNTLIVAGGSGTFAGVVGGSGALQLAGGYLKLAHASKYSGGTQLVGGDLDVAALAAAGTGPVVFQPTSGQMLTIENGALSNHAFGNVLTYFGARGVVDLTGLAFKAGASAVYKSGTHNLTVTSGRVSDTLHLSAPSTTTFSVGNDGNGGTEVFGRGATITVAAALHHNVDALHFKSLAGLRAASHGLIDLRPGEKVDLHLVDADRHMAGLQHFTFIGSAAFDHHAGELRIHNHVLSGDVNGDGRADFNLHFNHIVAHDLILA
jgi:autotransporter-associated beta strand protein